jgi:hypothetical protein
MLGQDRKGITMASLAMIVIAIVVAGAAGAAAAYAALGVKPGEVTTSSITDFSTLTSTVSVVSINPITLVRTTIITVTGQKSNTTTSSPFTSVSSRTSCISSGPTEGVVLRLVANGNTGIIPVAGAAVSGEDLWYCNDSPQITHFNSTLTNSSGWASLLFGGNGIYYLNVTYPNSNLVFTLSVMTQPSSVTYMIFNASTGNVTTYVCEFDHCLEPLPYS